MFSYYFERLEDLERGGYNSDLIVEMEEDIREEEYRKYMEDIERKHLEGLLSFEEAVLAKQKCIKKKKEQAEIVKREKDVWMKEIDEWKQEELIRLKYVVEKEKEAEKGVKDAVEHVKEEKHKLGREGGGVT